MKPTDRNIIINLYRNTQSKTLNWYVSSHNKNLEVWSCNQRITKNKSILYSINYKINDTLKSNLNIYLETKKDDNNLKSDIVKIRTIENSFYVFLLFKGILKINDYQISNKTYVIIENKEDFNKILLLKNNNYSYILPNVISNINNDSKKIEELVIDEIKNKTNLNVNIKKFDYTNIIKNNNHYYFNHLYLAINDNVDKINSIWIRKSVFHELKYNKINAYVFDENSLDILNYYNNYLPF